MITVITMNDGSCRYVVYGIPYMRFGDALEAIAGSK